MTNNIIIPVVILVVLVGVVFLLVKVLKKPKS